MMVDNLLARRPRWGASPRDVVDTNFWILGVRCTPLRCGGGHGLDIMRIHHGGVAQCRAPVVKRDVGRFNSTLLHYFWISGVTRCTSIASQKGGGRTRFVPWEIRQFGKVAQRKSSGINRWSQVQFLPFSPCLVESRRSLGSNDPGDRGFESLTGHHGSLAQYVRASGVMNRKAGGANPPGPAILFPHSSVGERSPVHGVERSVVQSHLWELNSRGSSEKEQGPTGPWSQVQFLPPRPFHAVIAQVRGAPTKRGISVGSSPAHGTTFQGT